MTYFANEKNFLDEIIFAKNSLKECVFVNSALNTQCHIVKTALLHTAFSAIFPSGRYFYKKLPQKGGATKIGCIIKDRLDRQGVVKILL